MRFRQQDAIALLAIPLLVAAFIAGGAVWPTICLTLAGSVIVFVVASHEELSWQRRIATSVIVFALDLGMVVYLYRVNLVQELNEQVAPLVAAPLASPVSSNCAIPKGAVGLYLGNTVSVVTKFPHVVYKVKGEDVLVLDRDSYGLLINFTAFDGQGVAVVRLERNVFTAINPAAHVERPSASNLIVFDDRESKVLDVQFLNPKAIKLTGILRFPGKEPIVISEKYVGVGGSISPPGCRSGEGAEFLFK